MPLVTSVGKKIPGHLNSLVMVVLVPRPIYFCVVAKIIGLGRLWLVFTTDVYSA